MSDPTPLALERSRLVETTDRAARAIPPVWPLASSVAVNPYLGQAGLSLAEAGALLARVAGAPVTQSRSSYRAKISERLREVLAPEDIVISDVGAHKLWIARMYPAQRPNTVIITNGFASMTSKSGLSWAA